MVSYQRKKDEFNDRSENYIYLFGGIKVINLFDKEEMRKEEAENTTSFVFMSDLWRYDLLSN